MVLTPDKPQTKNYNQIARDYILQIKKTGKVPPADDRADDFGPWNETILSIERTCFTTHQDINAVSTYIERLCNANKALTALLAPPLITTGNTNSALRDEIDYPQLPVAVQKLEAQANKASPWLDEYKAFSMKWSPRGYEGYHEAVGVSLLSATAGHRVSYDFGGPEYTPLYTALIGFTTLFKKTTTARLYYGVMHAAGLDWILGANITTPQKLLSDMAGRTIPSNYDDLPIVEQERIKKRLAMCAQRGWYYDEFGLHLDQMVKDSGIMSDFKGLLRILDDCMPVFENATQSRGIERIEKPYLSLLASMTPEDIRPHAQKNNKFWKDGLFARFTFVCPPQNAKRKRDRFPEEKLLYPASLIDPIKHWHQWLGEPEIDIVQTTNKAGNATGHTLERIKDLPERVCTATNEVVDAIYTYEDALLDIVEENKIPVALFGSYGRLHKVALRVAMLLASLDHATSQKNGEATIELRHWARGQQYAEARRKDLHELFAQVNGSYEDTTNPIEDAIFEYLSTLQGKPVNASYIKQNISISAVRKLNSKEITQTCDNMSKAGMLQRVSPAERQSACRYIVPPETMQGE